MYFFSLTHITVSSNPPTVQQITNLQPWPASTTINYQQNPQNRDHVLLTSPFCCRIRRAIAGDPPPFNHPPRPSRAVKDANPAPQIPQPPAPALHAAVSLPSRQGWTAPGRELNLKCPSRMPVLLNGTRCRTNSPSAAGEQSPSNMNDRGGWSDARLSPPTWRKIQLATR